MLFLLALKVKRPSISELAVGMLQLSVALRLLLEGQIEDSLCVLEVLAGLVVGSPANVEGSHLAASSPLVQNLVEVQRVRLHGYVLQP